MYVCVCVRVCKELLKEIFTCGCIYCGQSLMILYASYAGPGSKDCKYLLYRQFYNRYSILMLHSILLDPSLAMLVATPPLPFCYR